MARADFREARRLLCAANLAYGVVAETGNVPEKIAIAPPVIASLDVFGGLQRAVGFERGSFRTCESVRRVGIDAFVYGETNDVAVLAFRGTLPVRLAVEVDRIAPVVADWFNNTRARLVTGTPFGLPGYVHQGYANSLSTLWTAAGGLADLLPALRSAVRQGRRLLVTGHSKGGALAQLAALRLASIGDPDLRPEAVYTFAAPRAGNHAFARAFERALAGRVWRFEYQDDLVPHLPPSEGAWFALRSALLEVQHTQGGGAWAALQACLAAVSGVGAYASAGRLQFIDWDGKLCDRDTPSLREERLARLRRALAFSFPEVSRAHLPMRGFGYMNFLERHA